MQSHNLFKGWGFHTKIVSFKFKNQEKFYISISLVLRPQPFYRSNSHTQIILMTPFFSKIWIILIDVLSDNSWWVFIFKNLVGYYRRGALIIESAVTRIIRYFKIIRHHIHQHDFRFSLLVLYILFTETEYLNYNTSRLQ